MVFDKTVWQPDVIARMEDEYFGRQYDVQPSFWVRRFEESNNARTLRTLKRAGHAGGRLLEVGIGSGSFLVAARDRGFDVVGCDLSPHIASCVRELHGVQVHCGDLKSLLADEPFDVIVMNHVLEHVGAPVSFLDSAGRLLRPGGVLHIAVPNFACWEASLDGWISYQPYHLLYFERDTLTGLVRIAGYGVISVATHESFTGWFLALARSLLRRGPTKDESGAGHARRTFAVEHVYRLATVLCGLLTWPLRRVQSSMGYGDELVVMARKSQYANSMERQ